MPHRFLKRGARQHQGHREVAEGALKVGVELLLEVGEVGAFSWEKGGPKVFSKAFDLGFEHAAVGEFEEADARFRGSGQHGTQGREDAVYGDEGAVSALGGREARETLERLIETTQGFESTSERGVGDGAVVAYLAKGSVDAQCAEVGLKGHSVVLLEPPSEAGGVNLYGAEIVILPAPVGVLADLSQQVFYPFRRIPLTFHGPTDFAGTVAHGQGFLRRGEVFDVFGLGFARGTNGPTEDTCRLDAHNKNAFKAAVFVDEGLVHGGRWGERALHQTILFLGVLMAIVA